MAEFDIRPVRAGDAAEIAEIRRQATVMEFNNLLPTRRDTADQHLLEELGADNHFLVAVVAGRVVGFGRLDVFGGRQRHVGNIAVSVHDSCQGRGIGRALIAALLNIADDFLNLRRVQLDVWADNVRAIHLYESFGFELEGRKREAVCRRGEYGDVLTYGRLRH